MKDLGMRWSIRRSENMGYLLAEMTDGFRRGDLARQTEEAKTAGKYEVCSGNGYEEIWSAQAPSNQSVAGGKALQKPGIPGNSHCRVAQDLKSRYEPLAFC